MPSSTNKDQRNTIPDPELNPLINPLLAAHMGRWAEVYFTSPPEKREQAVSELLRELEKDSSAQPQPVRRMPVLVPQMQAPVAGMQDLDDEREHREQTTAEESSAAEAGEVGRTCSNCAHKNEAGQRFCGMCGSPLQSQQQADSNAANLHAEDPVLVDPVLVDPGPVNPGLVNPDLVNPDLVNPNLVGPARVEEEMPASEITWSQPSRSDGDSVPYGDNSVDYGAEYAVGSEEGPAPVETDNGAEPAWRLPEQDLPQFAVESPSVPYRYRLYVGMVLAISLGALLYMAWRGTQALSGVQSPPSRVMPAVRPEAPVPAPAAAPQSSAGVLPVEKESNRAAPVAAAPVAPTPVAAAPVAGKNQEQSIPQPVRGERQPTVSPRPVVASRKEPVARPRPADRIVALTTNSGGATPEAGGREELATADTYLGGSQGRNSREAAEWLWKAVGKGNVAATIELSDLYLRGDGVPKSCDQARLLLDAAARKGGKSAGERLRHLQAFGCQ